MASAPVSMKPTHGGARKGAGRHVAQEPKSVVFQLRCTPLQREQIKALGGSKWIILSLERAAKEKP